MSAFSADLPQKIALADDPADAFRGLPRPQQRAVFFHLSDALQDTIVATLTPDQLRAFIGRLDPDEAADVLGFFIFLGLAKFILGI